MNLQSLKVESFEVSRLIKYNVLVFKTTGKYYTTEQIDLPDCPVYELVDEIDRSLYPGMIKVLDPVEPNDSKFSHPVLIFPKYSD